MRRLVVSVLFIPLSVLWGHCADSDNGSSQEKSSEPGDGPGDTDTKSSDTDTTEPDSVEIGTENEIDTEQFIRMDIAELTSEPADFQQSDDENGLVIMEAEDYTLMVSAKDNSSWEETTKPEGYSGTCAMQAQPSEYVAHKELVYAQINAPILVYTVQFVKAGTVYVWGRASHIDGYTDSVWFGKNGLIQGNTPLSFGDDEHIYLNMWYYIQLLMEGGYATFEIPEPGVYTFELFMREPDFAIDKIVLTTNPEFHPDSLEE